MYYSYIKNVYHLFIIINDIFHLTVCMAQATDIRSFLFNKHKPIILLIFIIIMCYHLGQNMCIKKYNIK